MHSFFKPKIIFKKLFQAIIINRTKADINDISTLKHFKVRVFIRTRNLLRKFLRIVIFQPLSSLNSYFSWFYFFILGDIWIQVKFLFSFIMFSISSIDNSVISAISFFSNPFAIKFFAIFNWFALSPSAIPLGHSLF